MQVGDLIRVKKGQNTYEGILMPFENELDDKFITIKLENGYNVGFKLEAVSVKVVRKGKPFSATMPKVDILHKKGLPDIAIIGTGGTVASKIDYMTGAVYPAFSPAELLQLVPELGDIANISGKEILSIASEDIRISDWKNIGASIIDQFNEGCKGVVVTHGTDTLHFTSAMLSFMLRGLQNPVVMVGAQRSSDRPSSDAAFNLVSSVNFSRTDCKEVAVCMHSSLNDDHCLIHRGTRVRKLHTSRRDAFVSVNCPPIAKVMGAKNIEFISSYKNNAEGDLYLDDAIEEKVALIKTYPGARDIVAAYVDKGYKGIILEGTGLGHVPMTLYDEICRGIEEEVVFGMTSQCINGRVNMNVYRGGRMLKEAGVIPLEDMLPETAWCKMCWVLGHHSDYSEIKEAMLADVAGEIRPTSRIDTYDIGRW